LPIVDYFGFLLVSNAFNHVFHYIEDLNRVDFDVFSVLKTKVGKKRGYKINGRMEFFFHN
jgi:hypothetical protein